LVETQNGEWWMVLLGSRPYGGYFRNLGRETFLAPVSWEDDWPVINYGVGIIRSEEKFPNLPFTPTEAQTNFDFRKIREIPLNFMHLRNPVDEHYELNERGLFMSLNKNTIAELDTVSYLCVRQQHKNFDAQTQIEFSPASENECAGLVIFQSHKFNFQFVLAAKNKKNFLRVIQTENEKQKIISEMQINSEKIFLKISAREQNLFFLYSTDGKNFIAAHENASASTLNTDTAGGFVGNTIGMYATSNGSQSKNHAVFTEFSCEKYLDI